MTTPTQPTHERIWEIATEEYAKPFAAAFSGDEWKKPRTVQVAIATATRALAEQREWLLASVCSECGVALEDDGRRPYHPPTTVGECLCGRWESVTRAEYLSRQESKT